jgi:membrane protease subunit HflK
MIFTKFSDLITKKSPWDDGEDDNNNIFRKKRNNNSNNNNPFNFGDIPFKFDGKTIIFVLIALLALWMLSGIYKVQEGQQAAVIRFGEFHRVGFPGLNYHFPAPFEKTIIEEVNKSRRIEIGYRSSGHSRIGRTIAARDIGNESIMLTGDENIVELQVDVMWHIKDLSHFLFNVDNPTETVKIAAESAIREVIANTPISSVLSNKKQLIADQTEKSIQLMLDNYKAGVQIEQVQLLKAEPPKQVIQSYRDVQTAKADKEKEITQAQSYNNDLIPQARGKAAKMMQEAEGYKAEVVARAKGDTSRFNFVYKQYVSNKKVMRNRLYLDTMEEILKDADKVIMGTDGMLPHMPISPKNILDR